MALSEIPSNPTALPEVRPPEAQKRNYKGKVASIRSSMRQNPAITQSLNATLNMLADRMSSTTAAAKQVANGLVLYSGKGMFDLPATVGRKVNYYA